MPGPVSPSRRGASDRRAELRPRMVWRLALPVLALGWPWLDADQGPLVRYGIDLVLVLLATAAWRQYARLEDGVIFERGVFRWYPPLLLGEVEEVSLHYEMAPKDIPHRVLRLWTDHGPRAFSLRW